MTFRHLVKAANAASFGWQLSGSRSYLAAQVAALIEAPVPVFGVTLGGNFLPWFSGAERSTPMGEYFHDNWNSGRRPSPVDELCGSG
jgi:hypothetical protein